MRATVFAAAALVAAGGVLCHLTAQQGSLPDDVDVRAIAPPSVPLPPEAATAQVRKFSFIVYGDTRSQGPSRSGEPPPEHLARPGATIEDNPNHFVVVRVDGAKLSLEVVAARREPFRPYGRERTKLE